MSDIGYYKMPVMVVAAEGHTELHHPGLDEPQILKPGENIGWINADIQAGTIMALGVTTFNVGVFWRIWRKRVR